MITHVVLLRPRTETTEQDLRSALEHVQALKDAIPGIVAVTTGANHSSFNQGYTHGFIMEFTDESHLQQYATHAAHEPVSMELLRLCESIIDFDVSQD